MVTMLSPVTPLPASGSELVAIADIKVGERCRRDLGDIEAMSQCIAAKGLWNPIAIDRNGNLLAGARRLAACKLLAWTEIPAMVVRP